MTRRIQTFVLGLTGLTLASAFGPIACDRGAEGRPTTLSLQPRSLEGVDVDGSLELGPDGMPLLDARARAFFDHFLTAKGEVDDESLHALVREAIDARLEGEAADLTWETFLAYVDYYRESQALLERADEMDSAALASALDEIRVRTVGDTLGIADEIPDIESNRELERLVQSSEMPAEQRRERIKEIVDRLGHTPDPNAPSRILSRVHEALAEVPADDVEERRRVLVDLVGPDAAERWLALEQRRAAEALAGQG